MTRSIFFANLVVLVLTKPQVRVGIVPIFDGRSTQEPITFTFTAAPPTTAGPTAAYPVKYQNELPTLIPAGYQTALTDPNSSKKNIFVNQWQQSPYQAVTNAPTKPRTTPIYNQAQYYKAIQDGLISFQSAETVTTESPYKAMWAQIADSWQQTKSNMVASGVERDWRSLWTKLSGSIEPFLNNLAEQMGIMFNTYIKQRSQNRMRKIAAAQTMLRPQLKYPYRVVAE
ncbi:hypothetical protein Q1695_002667 [Nippostrongylus brasiliensis]|nr:hypothetical protein Q1695_002667 [Nippostrongylus brasiliensis]